MARKASELATSSKPSCVKPTACFLAPISDRTRGQTRRCLVQATRPISARSPTFAARDHIKYPERPTASVPYMFPSIDMIFRDRIVLASLYTPS